MHQVQRETFLHFIIFSKASVDKFRPRCASFLFIFTFEIVQIDGEKEPGNFHKQIDCIVIVPFAMQLGLFWISPGEIVQFEAGKGKKIFAAVLQHVFCFILQKLVFWLFLRTFLL